MLSTNVETTSDLMSIALQAEREAIRRYTMLADSMIKGSNQSAAALFKRMITEEEEHERLLLEWMNKEGILENTNIEAISWKDPHVSTVYNDEAYDPIYSTPYKALAFAVHNEEIAFRFYTHVAANSENPAVRKYAEILAREELGHAALLRAERRIAYHKEKEAVSNEVHLDPKVIHNEVDLLSAAIYIDNYLEIQMKEMSDYSSDIAPLISKTKNQIINNTRELKDTIKNKNVSTSDDLNNNLLELSKQKPGNTTTYKNKDKVQRLWSCCDRSFAFYDAVVESAEDEIIMLKAQELTSTALDRIGVLKEIFTDTHEQA